MKRRITRNRLLARYLRWLDLNREHRQMVQAARRGETFRMNITQEQWTMWLDNQAYRDKHWHKELEVK